MSQAEGGRGGGESRPAIDWGRVADGIGLAGFGLFFLLATTRGLPPGFWLDALSFWPVLLVSAGIRVIFEKSPLPWGVVLGPLVVLGTLAWLAWGERPSLAPPGEWREVSAVRPEGVEKVALRIQGVGARVRIEARALGEGVLAAGRAASRDNRARLRQVVEGNEVALRLEGHGGGATILPGRKALWELAVSDDVPMDVRVEGAMARSELHLEGGQVSGVEATGPFQAVVLRLPPPRGRVGIRLGGPFCAYQLIVPDGTRVHLGEHFPVSLVFRGPAREEPLGDEEAGYDVSFGGPFGSLTIEEAPLPEGVRVPEGGAGPSPPEAPPAGPGPPEAPPAEAPPTTAPAEATSPPD